MHYWPQLRLRRCWCKFRMSNPKPASTLASRRAAMLYCTWLLAAAGYPVAISAVGRESRFETEQAVGTAVVYGVFLCLGLIGAVRVRLRKGYSLAIGTCVVFLGLGSLGFVAGLWAAGISDRAMLAVLLWALQCAVGVLALRSVRRLATSVKSEVCVESERPV